MFLFCIDLFAVATVMKSFGYIIAMYMFAGGGTLSFERASDWKKKYEKCAKSRFFQLLGVH